MNSVNLIGRLCADPELRYTTEGDAACNFRIAVDRYTKAGKMTDFINIKVFKKDAENCKTYLEKGSQVGIEGNIRSGSYEKDGRTVYTTDVVARHVEFLGRGEVIEQSEEVPSLFQEIREDLPF